MTKIEWVKNEDGTLGKTWNISTGCTKISPGCKNCYAERMAKRLKAMGQPNYRNGFDLTMHEHMLEAPLRWKKPQRIFVNSMSDLFHEDVYDSFIEKVFAVMALCEWHTFQVLTKRPKRMKELFQWGNIFPYIEGQAHKLYMDVFKDDISMDFPVCGMPDNVWLGVSVESPDHYDRIEHLFQTPAAVRFLSLEPLLEPVEDICHELVDCFDYDAIDWVIVGAESGPNARPMELDWVRSIVNQCRDVDVPVFVKQLCKNGRKIPFDLWPEDLQIREWPK